MDEGRLGKAAGPSRGASCAREVAQTIAAERFVSPDRIALWTQK
jgi:hypothetical protein